MIAACYSMDLYCRNNIPNRGESVDARKPHHNESCVGKMQHTSAPAAQAHARSASRKYGETLGVYKCPHCPFWHVGHPVTKVKRTRRSQFP